MRPLVAILITALLVAAAPARSADRKHEIANAIANASSITMFSLEPGEKGRRDSRGACIGHCYFGWPVLGQTLLNAKQSKATRKDLAAWLAVPEPEAIMMCFDPRHGVRIVAGQHTYDFVVCFECAQAQVFRDSAAEPIAYLYRGTSQKGWDALLNSAGVALASPGARDGI